MALSDLVVVMNAGRVEQSGTPDEVYRRPASRFVADFIGRANFVEGRVERVDGGSVELALFGRAMTVPAAPGLRAGDTAVVVVRPESIRVGVGDLRGEVRRATFLGPLAEYEIEVDGSMLLAADPDWMGRGLHEPGESVAWSMRPEQAYVLPPSGASEELAPLDPEAV